MKNLIRVPALLLSFTFSFGASLAVLPSAQALPGDDCRNEQVLFGRWAINRFFTMADGCLVQVTPINKPNQTYREYVFDQSGRFMVFNSLPGEYEKTTAQRNFFLFPAFQVPSVNQEADRVIVNLANGSKVVFHKDSEFIENASYDLSFEDKRTVDLTPGGNFEITRYDGIMLDAGWAIGKRLYSDRNATSEFVVPGVGRCVFKNSELFDYEDPITREPYYQPLFKYPQPERLEAVLAKRLCVKLPSFPGAKP